ncbi:AMP-binding protein [Thalassomonas haliotis]|uniref:AMP-binding protein n=1 Tax=Thalassomonas haliotis TaxID=485448 RepID=A0ABY7V9J1_9GAMM|nr:AMP-binding protein [Thalassomonas haliotis]WDE09714.1 AMP-binding protein [Thalassomonas haliotis]
MTEQEIKTRLAQIWGKLPGQALLTDGKTSLTYQAFIKEVELLTACLAQHKVSSVALLADNSLQWVIVDFACQQLGIALLPLPAFFSKQQIRHSVNTAACQLLITDNPALLCGRLLCGSKGDELGVEQNTITVQRSTHSSLYSSVSTPLSFYRITNESAVAQDNPLPEHTSKVTFTSGTTGAPKGVCLSLEQQWQVALSLKNAVTPMLTDKVKRHLCLLPLSTLLENIAGIYAAMLGGATVVVPTLAELGFNGSSSLNFTALLKQIGRHQPSSLITTPEILKGLTMSAGQGWQVPSNLAFVAVGGARVSSSLISQAQQAGIPAFEGYGLSECASVVSVNNGSEHQSGSAGKPLGHVKVSVAEGEVVVSGNIFLGYAGDRSSWGQTRYATGDIGHIDSQGYLHITGRKKNTLISSFGRNINPEWLESELKAFTGIRQALVFGDSQPYCIAGILPQMMAGQAQVSDEQISAMLAKMNSHLPDYARVKDWFYLDECLFADPELNTANGRVRRKQMTAFLQTQIQRMYRQAS